MHVLVIGSGGREHALVWKIRQSKRVSALSCAPGNPGIAMIARCVPLKPTDVHGLAAYAAENAVDLTVVGPEQPLAEGIVDLFASRGLRIFGPTRRAAELEWSKAFAKEFMARNHVPTATYRTFTLAQQDEAADYLCNCPVPVVLKADGLAAGKGVLVCESRESALSGLDEMFGQKAFGTAGETVVIEEFLRGVEASVFAISDGKDFLTLAPAQDHKRINDGDRGKNTGGMGAYAPAPMATTEVLRQVEDHIIGPTLRGMAAGGRPYRGCLYVGLMLTADGPKVVEFNCRFGDPETQAVLPLLDADLVEILTAAADGNLASLDIPRSRLVRGHAACVVLASGGYPDTYPTGLEISGLTSASGLPGVVVFHAGTRADGDRVLTSGGRVLGVTAVSPEGTLREALESAYAAVRLIRFEGMHYRHDIGQKAFAPFSH